MQISILHILLIIIVCAIAASVIQPFRGKKGDVSNEKQDKEVKRSHIVGHEQATPMATRIAPAFAEQTDWSQFDQPTFLRVKKPQKKSSKRATQKAEAPADVKPAQSKPATAPETVKKARKTPQQEMDEFRANAKAREAAKPAYEQV